MNTVEPRHARFSIPSIIAIVAALFSFATGSFWGFVLAGIAIVFSLIGILLALSPSIRGGLVSTLSLILGGIGLVAAVIKTLMRVL